MPRNTYFSQNGGSGSLWREKPTLLNFFLNLLLRFFWNCTWWQVQFESGLYCSLWIFKVSEYPFKQNEYMFKNMKVLLYTCIYNISLNVLRPAFFNIYNLPFLHAPNIGKVRVNFGPKTNNFSYFMSSCTNRIAVFYIFFHWWISNQETNIALPEISFFSNIFWTIYF